MHSSNNILLIRPANFSYNPETEASNVFQKNNQEVQLSSTKNAIIEFQRVVDQLRGKGVNVVVVNDTEYPIKPDAIFPNNWISFHSNGTVILYPMLAMNRRRERREDIIALIREKYDVKRVIDLSENEKNNTFLEGTGSMVFDHINQVAYGSLSSRTDKNLFLSTCRILNYKPIHFCSYDDQGNEIYHTNVMMTIGNGFSVICSDSITNPIEKERVIGSLTTSGHRIIDISYHQMNAFCGNMIELELVENKNILAMSEGAFDSLTQSQKNSLEEFCELFPIDINTIERIGGGSVRCMITEIFLPLKNDSSTQTMPNKMQIN